MYHSNLLYFIHPVFSASHASRYNTLHFTSQSRVPNGGVAPFGNPHKKRRYATPPRGAYRLFCYPALRLYRLSKSQRGIGVVSLTMGNSALPLGHGLVADVQALGQRALGQSLLGAQLADQPTGLCMIHCFSPHRAIIPGLCRARNQRAVELAPARLPRIQCHRQYAAKPAKNGFLFQKIIFCVKLG